ncbi:uncharacterized protein LOC132631524 [Lycium barbarum]|uniref:uncharacterized protein LOC132631524 n=1 Tax=Lycium barbarum TaxID=112863 RepID=UPI00293E90C3|nr:uncharacterized protein LOC132631524 [Lycium barbarum]
MDARQLKESVTAMHTTHNGAPAVMFTASEYYGIMANECRLTMVGRFLKPRPQIDKLRSKFKELIKTKGTTTIGVYDNFNVFLDFTNEEDFNVVWYRRVIEIEGQQMWLQKWSPNFKPEEDLPIAPVWVLLPKLPFHLHTWHYLKQIVSSVGTPLEMDMATKGRTRPSMAKVRVEIDLLKPQPEAVYIGLVHENAPQYGYMQKLEYEGIPKYCRHCRKLGHMMADCRVLEKKKAAEKQKVDMQTMDTENGVNIINDKGDELAKAMEEITSSSNSAGNVEFKKNQVNMDIMKNTVNGVDKKDHPGNEFQTNRVGKYRNRKIYTKPTLKNKNHEDTTTDPINTNNDKNDATPSIPVNPNDDKVKEPNEGSKEGVDQNGLDQRDEKKDGDTINISNGNTCSSSNDKHQVPANNNDSINQSVDSQTHVDNTMEKSDSLPSVIKNMPGLDYIEVTSPNRVVVVILEEQLQQQQNMEDNIGFSPVNNKKSRNKKGGKKKKEDNTNAAKAKETKNSV